MVHHYQEEEGASPTSVVTTKDPTVRFNCQIDGIEPAPADEPPPATVKLEVKPKAPKCCPVSPPLAPLAPPSSDLVEALPVILVGIGVAYTVGMLTGAFIFSSSVVEI